MFISIDEDSVEMVAEKLKIEMSEDDIAKFMYKYEGDIEGRMEDVVVEELDDAVTEYLYQYRKDNPYIPKPVEPTESELIEIEKQNGQEFIFDI